MFKNIEKHIIFTVSNYFCSIYPCLSIKNVFSVSPQWEPHNRSTSESKHDVYKGHFLFGLLKVKVDLELPSLCDVIIRKSF